MFTTALGLDSKFVGDASGVRMVSVCPGGNSWKVVIHVNVTAVSVYIQRLQQSIQR